VVDFIPPMSVNLQQSCTRCGMYRISPTLSAGGVFTIAEEMTFKLVSLSFLCLRLRRTYVEHVTVVFLEIGFVKGVRVKPSDGS